MFIRVLKLLTINFNTHCGILISFEETAAMGQLDFSPNYLQKAKAND